MTVEILMCSTAERAQAVLHLCIFQWILHMALGIYVEEKAEQQWEWTLAVQLFCALNPSCLHKSAVILVICILNM